MSKYIIKISQCIVGIGWTELANVDMEEDATAEDATTTAGKLAQGLADAPSGRLHVTTSSGLVIDTRCGPVKFEPNLFK